MSEADVTTGTPIGFGHALLEQLRWFWRRLWVWIVVVTIVVCVAVVAIMRFMPPDSPPLAYVVMSMAFHPLLVLIAISWAMSAWRDDPPKDRQYFWLHPADRMAHTIARSSAGFLWLLVVLAIVIATVIAVTAAEIPADMAGDAARLWLYAFGAIVIAYLAASVPAILSDRPVIWILVAVGIVLIAASLSDLPQLDWLKPIVGVFRGEPLSFGAAISAPALEAARLGIENLPPGETLEGTPLEGLARARPGTALLIWLPVTLAAWLGAARASLPR